MHTQASMCISCLDGAFFTWEFAIKGEAFEAFAVYMLFKSIRLPRMMRKTTHQHSLLWSLRQKAARREAFEWSLILKTSRGRWSDGHLDYRKLVYSVVDWKLEYGSNHSRGFVVKLSIKSYVSWVCCSQFARSNLHSNRCWWNVFDEKLIAIDLCCGVLFKNLQVMRHLFEAWVLKMSSERLWMEDSNVKFHCKRYRRED